MRDENGGLSSADVPRHGSVTGGGIFVLTRIAAGAAGPALIVAFLLNGVVTTLTALSYAELGSSFPEAGGGYLGCPRTFVLEQNRERGRGAEGGVLMAAGFDKLRVPVPWLKNYVVRCSFP